MTTIEARRETRLLTAADLLRLDAEGVRGELIRGVLCKTMAAGQRHGTIVVNLVIELGNFVKPKGAGTLVASDSGVWLERDPDTVREPDIAFTSVERLPLGEELAGYAEVAPDLVVEVASPNDSRREVHDKAHMWLNHGVRLVWVVHPEARVVDVYRPDHATVTISAEGALDGLDVLPGFSCPLEAVFGPHQVPSQGA